MCAAVGAWSPLLRENSCKHKLTIADEEKVARAIHDSTRDYFDLNMRLRPNLNCTINTGNIVYVAMSFVLNFSIIMLSTQVALEQSVIGLKLGERLVLGQI